MDPDIPRSLGSQRFIFLLASLLLLFPLLAMAGDRCAICGDEMAGTTYLVTDKLTREKRHVCYDCVHLADACFVCGLPVRKDYVRLPDGRFLCARDAKQAVLDAGDAKSICKEVREDLDKLFSRFVTFPTNVEIAIVDRVNLLSLFKIPGNDFECPNVLGYFRATTNHNQIRHEISLMSALRAAELKATCAHEYSHAWVFDNVSEERRQNLGRDAQEGFCELVGYLLMDAQQEDDQKEAVTILSYSLWQERFHGDPGVLGTKVLLDRKPYVVIGVMPRNFEFPLVPAQFRDQAVRAYRGAEDAGVNAGALAAARAIAAHGEEMPHAG